MEETKNRINFLRASGIEVSPAMERVILNEVKIVRTETLMECRGLVGEDEEELPKKLKNPFYPQEGEKYLKMEGNINFMEGRNQERSRLRTAIDTLIKKETV